ncbi:MAG: 30S ribosomal protein S13 [archaeon]|nr:30S ribosomal protein S13 [archaeon]
MSEKISRKQVEDEDFNFIVRVADSDIDGLKSAVIGVQQIKGVGKRVAQIAVRRAGINPMTKIGSLTDDDIKKLEESITTYSEYAPEWIINRQLDYETGADMHLIGSNLEVIQKDDVNRMKMIRCYRGIRHETHHKVRGQRTRSNGRHGLTMGVSKKKE